VQGPITILSDRDQHNVNLGNIPFQRSTFVHISRQLFTFALPVLDCYLTSPLDKVKNESEYPLILESASIYGQEFCRHHKVILRFTSRVSLNSCPTAVLLLIFALIQGGPCRWHQIPPLERKAAQSVFISKSLTELFTQRIAIHNNKAIAIRNLDVIDVVPVSQDKRIDDKLLNILL